MLGLSPQNPLRQAYEQNPELVETWLAEDFPKIQALATREWVTLYFAAEVGIRSDHASKKSAQTFDSCGDTFLPRQPLIG